MTADISSLRANRRRRVAARSVAAVLLLAAVELVVAAPPARADCPLLDLGCVLDETVETVEGVTEPVEEVLDPVTETVGEVIAPIIETVNETVETVEGVVDPVVDTVEDVVEPATDPVEDAVDPVTGGGDASPGEGSSDRPAETVDGAAPPVPGKTGSPVARTANGSSGGRDAAVLGEQASTPPRIPGVSVVGNDVAASSIAASSLVEADGSAAAAIAMRPTGSVGGFAGAAAAAKRLAFPMLLVVLGVLFVVAENRLDRRDPKLAAAARVPEVVTFG